LALGLGLVAEEDGPDVAAVEGVAPEAVGDDVIAALLEVGLAGDGELGPEHVGGDGSVKGAREEACFEAGDPEDAELRQGDALDGKHLFGVDGLVNLGGLGFQAIEEIGFFDAKDVEGDGGESVRAGIPGGAGLAFRGTGSGGTGGVGPVGSELFGGDGLHSGIRYSTATGWTLRFKFASA
jgi:hypothetical protein